MTALCFVDSNVLIYARDPGEPLKHQRAQEWLRHLWQEGAGRTSTQVLSEFYVNVTRKLSKPIAPEDAWREVKSLFTWDPHPIDAALLERAREIEQRWRLSWRDSMVVAAAQAQGCAVLLTEDLQDGAVYGGVTVRSPFTLDVREPIPACDLAEVETRHRRRGRPRKSRTATYTRPER